MQDTSVLGLLKVQLNRRMNILFLLVLVLGFSVLWTLTARQAWAQPSSSNSSFAAGSAASGPAAASLRQELGVVFIDGSTSTMILERNGKKYLINLATRKIQEADPPPSDPAKHLQQATSGQAPGPNSTAAAQTFKEKCSSCHGADGTGISAIGTPNFTDPKVQASISDEAITNTIKNGKPGTMMPAWSGKLSDSEIAGLASFIRSLGSAGHRATVAAEQKTQQKEKVYEPPDDFLYSLPTGRKLDRHGVYVNFTHRFAYDPAFSGSGRGAVLLGLDGFSLSSFGFRYGVTDKLSVSAYRSPSAIGRPIELGLAYHLLDEHDGSPLNATFRFSVDGQDDFSKNFTTNFEGIFSRTLFKRVQLYVVPTLSLQNRELISKPGELQMTPPTLPGINSFSVGVGGAFDIRPTVALIAEVIPTVVHGPELGIHRPAFGFGIQKRLWRHAFTLGFSNNPGTIVAQRAGTRATFVGDPSGDTGSGLFIGFDLMRQIY